MHARFVALTLISLSVFTVAAVLPRGNDSCSTGPQQCCNEVRDSKDIDDVVLGFLSMMDIDTDNLIGSMGFHCSPIGASGVASTDCNGQVVCCQNNNFNGMFALGCSSINMPL